MSTTDIAPTAISAAEFQGLAEELNVTLFAHRDAPTQKQYEVKGRSNIEEADKKRACYKGSTKYDTFRAFFAPDDTWAHEDFVTDCGRHYLKPREVREWADKNMTAVYDGKYPVLKYEFYKIWRCYNKPRGYHVVLLRLDLDSPKFIVWRIFKEKDEYTMFLNWWTCAWFENDLKNWDRWVLETPCAESMPVYIQSAAFRIVAPIAPTEQALRTFDSPEPRERRSLASSSTASTQSSSSSSTT